MRPDRLYPGRRTRQRNGRHGTAIASDPRRQHDDSGGATELGIADDFVSPDMPDAEIIQRVTCLTNAAIRIVEEVPEPDKSQVLVDGGTAEEDPLHAFAKSA